jgi:hypothetical protein
MGIHPTEGDSLSVEFSVVQKQALRKSPVIRMIIGNDYTE